VLGVAGAFASAVDASESASADITTNDAISFLVMPEE
jgi:hypothetical protein